MVKFKRSFNPLKSRNQGDVPNDIMDMFKHMGIILVLLFFDFLIRKAAPEADSVPKLYKIVKMLEGFFAGIVYMLIRYHFMGLNKIKEQIKELKSRQQRREKSRRT